MKKTGKIWIKIGITFVILLSAFLAISHYFIWADNQYQIGPHAPLSISKGYLVSTSENEPVSFKSKAPFILVSQDTGSIIAPATILPQTGEIKPTYLIKEVTLDGQYLIDFGDTTVYSENESLVTVATGQNVGNENSAVLFFILFIIFVLVALMIPFT